MLTFFFHIHPRFEAGKVHHGMTMGSLSSAIFARSICQCSMNCEWHSWSLLFFNNFPYRHCLINLLLITAVTDLHFHLLLLLLAPQEQHNKLIAFFHIATTVIAAYTYESICATKPEFAAQVCSLRQLPLPFSSVCLLVSLRRAILQSNSFSTRFLFHNQPTWKGAFHGHLTAANSLHLLMPL